MSYIYFVLHSGTYVYINMAGYSHIMYSVWIKWKLLHDTCWEPWTQATEKRPSKYTLVMYQWKGEIIQYFEVYILFRLNECSLKYQCKHSQPFANNINLPFSLFFLLPAHIFIQIIKISQIEFYVYYYLRCIACNATLNKLNKLNWIIHNNI